MPVKEKWIILAASLLLLTGFATFYYFTNVLFISLPDVEGIYITKKSVGNRFVNDAKTVRTLVNSLKSSIYIKGKPDNGGSAGYFSLQVSGMDNSWIDIEILAPNKIVYNGYIYKAISDSAIDFSFLEDLFPDKNIAISISIKEGTLSPTGATLVYANDSEVKVIYGEGFSLEEKTDDVWASMDIIINNPAVHDIGHDLGGMQIEEIEINWVYAYGKLTPGEYRISTYFLIRSGNDVCDYLRSTEFIIE